MLLTKPYKYRQLLSILCSPKPNPKPSKTTSKRPISARRTKNLTPKKPLSTPRAKKQIL